MWATGALVSNIGTWMRRVGQDWLVLTVLTAGSATALGVATGLQFPPLLLLAPFAGLIADKFRKRRILLGTQTLRPFGLSPGCWSSPGGSSCGTSTRSRVRRGSSPPSTHPARQAFVSEMVPEDSSPTPSG